MGNKKTNNMYQMVIGDDIGNGCVKGCIKVNDNQKERFDFQSVAAVNYRDKKAAVDERDISYIINDIFNHMEVSFASPAIHESSKNTHYLIGESALSRDLKEEFDVNSGKSKAESDISSLLTLATIAGKALQTYFSENRCLPSEILNVEAVLSMALPILETVKGYDDLYKKKLLHCEHIVTFHNFQIPVTVKITFSHVGVLPEGSAAQYAINTLPPETLTDMLNQARRDGMMLDGIEARHIIEAECTIGIDIGDGTVNFPVYCNGQFDKNRSTSIKIGHGKILENAADDLKDNYNEKWISDRKDLASFLSKKPAPTATPAKIQHYENVVEVVRKHERELANTIVKKLNAILETTPQLDAAFVYGGGATPVKEYLYPQLIAGAKIGNSDLMYPVLYMDSNYSRFLNREGLYTVAEAIEKSVKSAQ